MAARIDAEKKVEFALTRDIKNAKPPLACVDVQVASQPPFHASLPFYLQLPLHTNASFNPSQKLDLNITVLLNQHLFALSPRFALFYALDPFGSNVFLKRYGNEDAHAAELLSEHQCHGGQQF